MLRLSRAPDVRLLARGGRILKDLDGLAAGR
jgi:hypothetical protein